MFSVLILEDEAMLRASMARAIQRLPGVVVVEAGTVAEAVAVLDRGTPDLVLSDIDLPDRSGVEMLGELAARRLATPLVFISAYLKAYGSQIPPHARVEVREKPVSVEDLRSLVQRHMNARTQPQAGVPDTPFGVPDYLQIACMGRHSVVMDVQLAGSGGGRIIVVNGQLHHAQDPLGKGAAAFQRLVMVQAAQVHCHTLHADPGPCTITAPWEGLMLDAARAQDEALRDLDAPVPDAPRSVPAAPAPPPAPAEPPPPPARTFADAFDEGVTALLRREHARAFALFSEAESLQPGEPRATANLVRLRAMGHGTPA